MPRAEQLVTAMRDALSQAGSQSNAEPPVAAAELARSYAAAVEEANQRLTRCLSLVRQGLRSEAIHQAELPPPILEEAATLDFPQRGAWVDLCRAHGLTIPAAISEAAAIEIDEAFPRELRQTELLTRHRRLALMRAPLASRIRVLRRLAQVDLDNPVWAEDLASFEKARHKQLIAEARLADRADDRDAIQRLYEEVTEPWQSAPPNAVVEEITQMIVERRSAEAKAQLAGLRQKIAAAHAASEVDALDALLQQHDEALRQTDGDPKDPEPVAEARLFLEQALEAKRLDARVEDLIDELRHGIDVQQPAAALVGRLEAIHALGRPAPEELEEIVHARHREAAAREAARQKLRMAGVALIAAVLLGLVIFGVVRAQNKAAADKAFTAVRLAVDEDQYAEARTLLDEVAENHAGWFSQERFQELNGDVDAWIDTERRRADSFAKTMATFEEEGPYNVEPGRLTQMRGVARTDAERTRLATFEAQVEAARARTDNERNQDVSERLTVIENDYRALSNGPAQPEWVDELLRIRRELGELRRVPNIRASLRRRLELLDNVTQTALSNAERIGNSANRQREAIRNLGQASVNPASFFGLLETLVEDEELPERLRTDLRRVGETRAATLDAIAWSQASGTITQASVTDLAIARTRLQGLNTYINRTPAGRYQSDAMAYVDYLRRAASALSPDRAPLLPDGDLAILLGPPLVDELKMYELVDGRRWYTASDAEGQQSLPGNRLYRVFIDPIQAIRGEMSDRTLPDDQVDNGFRPVLAPQATFADAALDMLARPDLRWETLHLDLLSQLMSTQGIDPVHRAQIARDLISLSLDRDALSFPELAQWDQRLATVRTDVNWLDPTNIEADRQRVRAVDGFAAAPAFAPMRDRVASTVRAFEGRAFDRRPIAVLTRQAEIGPATEPSATELFQVNGRTGGKLWAIVVDAEASNGWRWVEVAGISSIAVRWRDAANSLPTGTLLFYEPPRSGVPGPSADASGNPDPVAPGTRVIVFESDGANVFGGDASVEEALASDNAASSWGEAPAVPSVDESQATASVDPSGDVIILGAE